MRHFHRWPIGRAVFYELRALRHVVRQIRLRPHGMEKSVVKDTRNIRLGLSVFTGTERKESLVSSNWYKTVAANGNFTLWSIHVVEQA